MDTLSNEFIVRLPIDKTWAVLTDVERIAPCLPGAELQEVEGDVVSLVDRELQPFEWIRWIAQGRGRSRRTYLVYHKPWETVIVTDGSGNVAKK